MEAQGTKYRGSTHGHEVLIQIGLERLGSAWAEHCGHIRSETEASRQPQPLQYVSDDEEAYGSPQLRSSERRTRHHVPATTHS
jgi:hypothetical protein